MDTDEVMLDWGAHDDDEGAQVHSQDPSGIVGQESVVAKDEATLSGAESLLALASGGVDAQDDRDSDVVSLGGGDDDMEELYAYQSRTHLGGVASGDPKLDEPAQSTANEEANSEDRKSTKTLAASTSPALLKNSKNLFNDPVSDTSRPHSKPSSQPKLLVTENARSPPTTRLAPPSGALGLPAKPVAAPTTPYIRPSHPSIMSASSMAAPARERDRDLQRDHHDGMKSKHGPHGQVSPETDALPLAPGWETRRARDGTQDMYYYNTKTQQSTWSRSIATGMSSAKPEGSASPAFSRGRVKEQFQSSGLESPVARDITHSAGHDTGTQPRTRPTRFDSVRAEPTAPPNAPVLTFEERHYRPNDKRSPERSPPLGNGDLRQQQQARGTSGSLLVHPDQSPASHPTHPPLRRGNDRDLQAVNSVQTRGRDDRELPPYSDRAPGRNGERRLERERSRSPGRARSRNAWPDELLSNPWVRDGVVSSSNERRASAVLEGHRPSYGGSSPPLLYRGPPQTTRSSSLGREDRSRYAHPNHDQSSSRDRHRSPPPLERPRKRTRSKSPVFNNANQRQAFRPAQPQALRPGPWNDFDPSEARHRDYATRFESQARDRPPHQHPEPSPLLTSKPYVDRHRNGSSDRDRFGEREVDRENDAKRQKIFDNPDSAVTRRPHLDSYSDRDPQPGEAPRRKRQPLPPQSERFKEMAAGPPGPPLPPHRHVPNGPPPPATPSGPRRLPNREPYPIDSSQQDRVRSGIQRKDLEDARAPITNNSQARVFEMNDSFAEGKHYEERGRARQWDRERDRTLPAELPTGPRAMDHDAEPPMFSRRGRSPLLERTDRSPPPHFPTNGPRLSDRRDYLAPGGLRHITANASDRSQREPDRQSVRRVGENQEFGHTRPFGPEFVPDSLPFKPRFQQQQPLNRPAFSSNHPGAHFPVATRRSGVEPATTEDVPSTSLSSLANGPEKSSVSDDRREPRMSKGSSSFSQDPNLAPLSGNGNERRQPSFSGAPSLNMRSQDSLPPGSQASHGLILDPKSSSSNARSRESLSVAREDNAEQRSEVKGDVEPQPSGPSGSSSVDLERPSLNTSRPPSPPSGSRAVRIRRPSRYPDSTSAVEPRGPAGRGQPQAGRLPRQGSLLDRLSNPSSTPGVTPPLRDRVSSPGENWKRSGTGPQLGPGTSLRDRLEDFGDARHARNFELDQALEDGSMGANRRDRQNRRDKSRRGGRG